MRKKRKIDFVIEDYDHHRKILRFYPKQSSVHGFRDEPPKTWDEVYKVYYSLAVLYQDRFDENDGWRTTFLYEDRFDENSCLDNVARCIDLFLNGESTGNIYTFYAFGDGTTWEIKKRDNNWRECEDGEEFIYDFTLIKPHYGSAVRFSLYHKEIKKLMDTINEFEEHMLKNSQGI